MLEVALIAADIADSIEIYMYLWASQMITFGLMQVLRGNGSSGFQNHVNHKNLRYHSLFVSHFRLNVGYY
jgi:hypothetical protein